MKNESPRILIQIISIFALLFAGGAVAQADVAKNSASSSKPSIDFKKTKLTLGTASITAEVADTNPKRERGLMDRTTLKDSEGMIFIFDVAQQQGFWMKDTLIPLSIGFFSDKGILFQIQDMDPASPVELNPKTYLSAKPALYALEVPQGWFKRKKVTVGTQLKLPELHIPR